MPMFLKWTLAVSLVLTASRALADDQSEAEVWAVSYSDRLEEVEAELGAVRTQLESRSECGGCSSSPSRCAPCPPCCCQACGLYAGYAFVFAKPRFGTAAAYSVYEYGDDQETSTEVGFDFDYELSPRIWLGYAGPGGLGVRARYWEFDHAGNPFSLECTERSVYYESWAAAHYAFSWASAEIGETMDIRYGLELDVADFEVTQQINFRRASIVASGGIRYARMAQDFHTRVTVTATGELLEQVDANRVFEGLGPTIALALRRPIGSRGLALFGTVRGSVLLGETNARLDELQVRSEDEYDGRYDTDDVIGVGEAEIGVEWVGPLAEGICLLLRSGYQGQIWVDADAPNNSFYGTPLGFDGFSFAIGLSR